MTAIDTNLVIRLLLDDDPAQSAAARALLRDGGVILPPTVILETLWVLRSCYGATGDALAATVGLLARLPAVTIGTPEQCAEFFRLWRGGLDPEDAVHLAFAGDVDAFVTSDRALVKRAKKLGSATPVALASSRPARRHD
jgi:predicted nucleic acid-binding protein